MQLEKGSKALILSVEWDSDEKWMITTSLLWEPAGKSSKSCACHTRFLKLVYRLELVATFVKRSSIKNYLCLFFSSVKQQCTQCDATTQSEISKALTVKRRKRDTQTNASKWSARLCDLRMEINGSRSQVETWYRIYLLFQCWRFSQLFLWICI